MKKLGRKVILSLLMCLTVLSTSLTAFAEDTDALGNDIDIMFRELPIVDNVSDYIGITEEVKNKSDSSFFVNSDYSYAFIYEKDDVFKIEVAGTDAEGNFNYTEEVISSVSDIPDSNFFNCGKSSNYQQINASFQLGSIIVVVKDNDTIKYVSKFASKDELPILDLSYDAIPRVSISISNSSEKEAVLKVDYSLDEKFIKAVPNSAKIIQVELWSDLECIDSISLGSDDDSSSKEFKVSSNGNYYAKAITYITEGKSDSIDVTSISTKTPEEYLSENQDKTAPVVTFSSFLDSQTTGTVTELTMFSDEKAYLNFNGTATSEYTTELKFNVSENGEYNYTAIDENGNTTKGTLKIEFFKSIEDGSINDADRDSFWGDSIEAGLPRTGSIALVIVILIGVSLIGAGFVFVIKSRKKKSLDTEEPSDSNDITVETSNDEAESDESTTDSTEE